MRRITFAVVSTIAAIVLLFSYRTSRVPVETSAATTGGAQAGVVSGQQQTNPPAGASPDPTASSTPQGGQQTQQQGGQQASKDVTVNGNAVQTEQGPVQVQVKIAGGKIVDVAAIQKPSGDQRHDEISSFSLPKLRDQALAAQSAQIDGVSGATATSGGYKQSARDAANFG
jgi:uncharacterized protein with FMN-binding domain